MQLPSVMGITGELTQEINQVLQDLVSARDDARVRAHLLGLEARQRLGDLEREIENFERKLSARGEWVAEQILATARGLTRAVADVVAPVREQTPARVLDAMTRSVVTCRAEDSLNRAAQVMWEADCGAVPIVDDHGLLIGMLTDRDICMAAYTRGLPLAELSVSSVMSTALHSCKPGDSLRSLMDAMAKYQVRRVPVVDDHGKLVGIVSLADVARLAQAPSVLSNETRIWVPGVLAGISAPARAGDGAASAAS
jgi:CBS domain-containing protein